MARLRQPLLAAALVAALAGCGDGAADAPGGVSPGEAEALEDAADMLDERALPPQALPPEVAPPPTVPSTAAPAEVTGDGAAQAGR